jgi:hypothetical protein
MVCNSISSDQLLHK